MKRKLSPRALYALVAGGLVVYLLVGWFVIVSPKRAEATKLGQEVAAKESALAAAREAQARSDDTQPIAVADIFRLATAMPSVPDMPGILLELSRIAEETGIEFESVAPQLPVADESFQRIPITLAFAGTFYELSDFLFRLRTLVGVHSSELHAQGRLFSVDALTFSEAAAGFPDLAAGLTATAYVYGSAAPAAPPAAPASTESSTPPESGVGEAAPAEASP